MRLGDVNNVMHGKRARRIWGWFEKSQLVESCRPKKKGGFRLLTVALWRVRTWFGADGKVSRERRYFSPYVEKPLNSKVIKSFVPELRRRKSFFVFRDSYVLCIYVMNILCTFHIFMYGYVTIAYQFVSRPAEMTWDLRHQMMCRVWEGQYRIVSIGFYDLYLSPRVAKDWR